MQLAIYNADEVLTDVLASATGKDKGFASECTRVGSWHASRNATDRLMFSIYRFTFPIKYQEI